MIGRRPKTFRIKDSTFIAPARERYGQAALLLMMGAGSLIKVGAIVAIPYWVAAVLFLIVRRPHVVLTPAAIIVQRLRRRIVLDWDELAPGAPNPPVKRHEPLMRLYLMQTPIAEQWFASEDLPVGMLHIDPTFLANAVRHYIEHPEHRAAIGTQVELDRLIRTVS